MTESSSSEEMEPSKVLKDPLALGRHLVHELDLDDRVDTLGRWTAHYLADLIHEAENAKTDEERDAAKEKALEAILKIWDNRTSLPGKAYPLRNLGNVLAVLERMHPVANPFLVYVRLERKELNEIVANLYKDFVKLIPTLLFLEFGTTISAYDENPTIVNELSETEQNVLEYLTFWMQIFRSTDNEPKDKDVLDANPESIDYAAIATARIDHISKQLEELKELIGVSRKEE